jgi:hypothetical protein
MPTQRTAKVLDNGNQVVLYGIAGVLSLELEIRVELNEIVVFCKG